MKIFTPNVKLVEELTKYIRPQEIEKARFKNFNTPTINDGNLLCDEFFRTEELFNKKNDVMSSFHPYSIDDIPVIDRASTLARDIRTLANDNGTYIESDLPYYVDIIGENKRLYFENYGTKSVNSKRQDLINEDEFGYINRRLYTNRTIDEVVNIRYHAKQIADNDFYGLEVEALSLMKEGYPLEGVINIMKAATLKSADGKLKCVRGFMRFIAEYPDLRNYMITFARNKSEVFDAQGAKMFTDILEACDGDKKLAYRILWDCRVEMQDGSFLTNPDLLTFGIELFNKDKTWTSQKAQLIQAVSEKNNKLYKRYINQVRRELENGLSVQEITNKLFPQK